jgi:glutathione S-transferase
MKLYYSPGACSLSPHIALREAGLRAELVRVDLKARQTSDGANYAELNPKGYVPLLELDDGRRLTEGPAIVQWIADQKPASGLAPANGTFERYQLQEWLNFITSELHKQFSPLFNPNASADWKDTARQRLNTRFAWLEKQLANRPYLMGDGFTVADAYLFTMMFWTRRMKLDMSAYPTLLAYMARIEARPAVAEAMKAEGLAQPA